MQCSQPFGPLGSLKGGAYRLTVYGNEGAPGRYRFTLLPIRKQEFAIEIGDTVRTGVPAAGAGDISEPGELDVYTFRGPGKTVSLLSQPVEGSCPEFGAAGWRLTWKPAARSCSINRCSAASRSTSRLPAQRRCLPPDGLRQRGAPGRYRHAAPDPQAGVCDRDRRHGSHGVLAAGAGDISEPGELDVYTFRGPGKTVSLLSQPVEGSCPEFGAVGWRLTQEASGKELFDQSMQCSEPLGEEGLRLEEASTRSRSTGTRGRRARTVSHPWPLGAGDHVLGEAVRERRDCVRRVGADGTRHDRAVRDHEPGIAEHLAVRVHHALPLVPPHWAAAERMHRDHATEVPGQVVLEPAVEDTRDLATRAPHVFERRIRAALVPVDVEQPIPCEPHRAVRDVPAHGEERQRRRGQRPAADEARHVGADVARASQAEPELDQAPEQAKHAHDPGRLVAEVDQPVDGLRIAAVLDVIRAPGASSSSSFERIVLVITGP